MRLILPANSLPWILRWAQRLLFTGAAVMLGYCVFVAADTWTFQRREARNLERLAQAEDSEAPVPVESPLRPLIGKDGLIGRIEVRRLGISVVVVEGTGQRALRHAAGHIAGTALPGQIGNMGISAHRDTFFRPLRNIQPEDVIVITTPRGEYRYSVVSTRIVTPDDIAVLNSDGGEILTLVTCYPFYFVGPAPKRFIVRAERIL